MMGEPPEEFPELRRLLVAHQGNDKCPSCNDRWAKIKIEA